MTTLTEIVAAVAVHSSAAALSHFGVMVGPGPAAQPALAPAPAHVVERVIARTPRTPDKLAGSPKPHAVPAALRA